MSEADDSDLPAQTNKYAATHKRYRRVYRLRRTRKSSETNSLKREFQLRRTHAYLSKADDSVKSICRPAGIDKYSAADKAVEAIRWKAQTTSGQEERAMSETDDCVGFISGN